MSLTFPLEIGGFRLIEHGLMSLMDAPELKFQVGLVNWPNPHPPPVSPAVGFQLRGCRRYYQVSWIASWDEKPDHWEIQFMEPKMHGATIHTRRIINPYEFVEVMRQLHEDHLDRRTSAITV